MRCNRCPKVNEDFLVVAFILWLGLSVAITSAVAFLCFENRIHGDADRLSGSVLNWYNQWLTGCAWACLAGGILAPATLLAPILLTNKCVAVTSTILVWVVLSIPAPVLLSRLVDHTEELLTGYAAHGLIRLKHEVLTDAEQGMKTTLLKYTRGQHPDTDSWDRFQKHYKCCGVYGHEDFYKVNRNTSHLPNSCCKLTFDNHFVAHYDCGHKHKTGCYIYVVGIIQKTVQNVCGVVYISFFLLTGWSVATLAATLPWLGVKVTPKQIELCKKVRKSENGVDMEHPRDGRQTKVTFKED